VEVVEQVGETDGARVDKGHWDMRDSDNGGATNSNRGKRVP